MYVVPGRLDLFSSALSDQLPILLGSYKTSEDTTRAGLRGLDSERRPRIEWSFGSSRSY